MGERIDVEKYHVGHCCVHTMGKISMQVEEVRSKRDISDPLQEKDPVRRW
jgi:hypothetical protein